MLSPSLAGRLPQPEASSLFMMKCRIDCRVTPIWARWCAAAAGSLSPQWVTEAMRSLACRGGVSQSLPAQQEDPATSTQSLLLALSTGCESVAAAAKLQLVGGVPKP
jgi:hypothetical protein